MGDDRLVGERVDQRVLGLEVVVERTEGDIGSFGDLADGRGVDALLADDRAGRVEQGSPRALPSARAALGRGGRGCEPSVVTRARRGSQWRSDLRTISELRQSSNMTSPSVPARV